MIIASIPILVALVGLALYGLGSGKVAEIGRLLFFAGVLVALLHTSAGAIRVLP
jgi:hypothetical protein